MNRSLEFAGDIHQQSWNREPIVNQIEIDFFFKAAAVLIGVITGGIAFYNVVVGRKGHLRDEYKYAKEFLRDLRDDPAMHPYVKEKGLQALANDRSIVPGEIEYVLSLPSPVSALRDYVLGRAYLEVAAVDGQARIRFKLRYRKAWQRNWRKWSYTAAYGLLALLAYSPLLLAAPLHLNAFQLVASFAGAAAAFVPCAWIAIRSAAEIYRAEALVRSQDGPPPSNDGGNAVALHLASG